MPCYMVMAVAKRHPMETMPFHRTGKTLSFRYSAYLYDIAFRKYRHINLVSNVWSLVSSKFFLSTFAFCLLPFYLNGLISVLVLSLYLSNDVGFRFND